MFTYNQGTNMGTTRGAVRPRRDVWLGWHGIWPDGSCLHQYYMAKVKLLLESRSRDVYRLNIKLKYRIVPGEKSIDREEELFCLRLKLGSDFFFMSEKGAYN